MKPTAPQLRLLRSLAAADYIEYRFDVGGAVIKTKSGEGRGFIKMPTVDACFRRDWLTYTVHQFGPYPANIERRYTLTDYGRALTGASR